MRFVPRRRLARGLGVGVGVGLVGAVLSLFAGTLELEESVALGWLFAQRGPLPPPDDVVVVGVSRDSAEALGVSPELDEWPRALHAELVESLSLAGAKVIVFDIYFHQARDPVEDARLAAALTTAGNVILLERVRSDDLLLPGSRAVVESRNPPIDELKRGALASAPFTLPVVPIRTNQFWTFGRAAGDIPTLPVVALQAHLLDEYERLVEHVRRLRPGSAADLPAGAAAALDARDLEEVVRRLREVFRADPDLAAEVGVAVGGGEPRLRALLDLYAGADHRYLNYYGPAKTIRTVPYDLALRSADAELAGREFAGRTVFVGYSESRQSEQQDAFISVYSQRSGQNLSGVEIGATAFANLLERRSIETLPIGAHVAAVFAFGVTAGLVLAPLTGLVATAVAIAVAAAYAAVALWQFSAASFWLPLVVPVLVQLPLALFATLLWTYHRVRVQRERIEAAFGYFLPAREVKRFAERHFDAGATGEVQCGTCLVTDVERYTAVSERLHPTELRALLNRYYAVMLEVVERRGGIVTDFAGDSMVAVWGADRPKRSCAVSASLAAIEIARAMQRFEADPGGIGLPTAVGLDTGLVLLGSVGAGRRFEYRAVGDIVTTSSRLQGLNRALGTRVLASGATVRLLEGELSGRRLGTFRLRGKREPIEVWELLGQSASRGDAGRGRFEEALAALDRGDVRGARALFAALAHAEPADGPARFYAALTAKYDSPGAPRWAGIVEVDSK